MKTQEIVQKLWNFCNVLRDDGISYHQYITELTYILFLKMAKETGTEKNIAEGYRWDDLVEKDGLDLKSFYKKLLSVLADHSQNERIRQIYFKAATNIDEPKNLEKIIKNIDGLDWYSAKEEGLGNLYEALLTKNVNESKFGAGQYFTPRPLINVMVRLIEPRPGEKCNDPACGTFGFMIAADAYVKAKTDNFYELSQKEADFQVKEAFTGCELVADTHKLALMNAMLHGMEGEIRLGDSLSSLGELMKDYDVVLTNPPFGTKKGGERTTRYDFPFSTSNNQLNFLQHIYLSLNKKGTARAAVVLTDNVLFEGGAGSKIRTDLLDKCNLHTVLRLPNGMFYSQGIKTNVLFMTRGKGEKNNTQEVWIYDLRTNMESLGKMNPISEECFEEFERTFYFDREEKLKLDRWSIFTIDEIKARNYTLDLGLIRDDSVISHDDSSDPIESAEEAIVKIEQAAEILSEVARELRQIMGVSK